MKNYIFHAYCYGVTSGQPSEASLVVTNCPDKPAAVEFAKRHLGAYKVHGKVIPDDPQKRADWNAKLFGRPCPVVEFPK